MTLPTKEEAEARAFKDSLEYEKLADGHDDRAALNESLARAFHLPEAERTICVEIANMHRSLAGKYRSLARIIRDGSSNP